MVCAGIEVKRRLRTVKIEAWSMISDLARDASRVLTGSLSWIWIVKSPC